MNIGIDLREVQDFPTGIGRYFKGLVYGLSEVGQKHQYTLITNDIIPKFIEGELRALPDNFKTIRVKSKTKTFVQYATFPLDIRGSNLDVLITSPYGYSPFLHVKVALVILDQIYRYYPEYASVKAKLYMRFIDRLAAGKSSLILTDSKDARRDIIRFLDVPDSKVYAIHLAADPVFRRISSAGNMKHDVFKRYNIKEPYAMFVGNRRPHKNLKTLLKAFFLVKDRLDLHLVIVGGVDSRFTSAEGLESLITNYGLRIPEDITLTGHIPDGDVAELYQHALCLVHPALMEGFGLTPLEAMASGCPVISANKSSIPEVVGEAGLLIDPINEKEIADTLVLLAESQDLREGLIEKGFQRAKEFSWGKTARKTLSALQSIIVDS